MRKLLLILALWELASARFVYRIIRKQHNLELGFENDDFIRLVDQQFQKFSTSLDVYEKSVKKCIDEFIPNPDYCEHKCLGKNFDRFSEGLDFVLFKNFAIFQHIIDVAFNENCLGQNEIRYTCIRMIKDIKYLLTNSMDVIESIQSNSEKYVKGAFQKKIFNNLINLLSYLFDQFQKYEKESETRKSTMQGTVWVYFQTKKATYESVLESGDQVLESDAGDDTNAISMEIIRRIGELYPQEHDRFREYISVMQLPNPFEYEDNLAIAEMNRIKEMTKSEKMSKFVDATKFQNPKNTEKGYQANSLFSASTKTIKDVKEECKNAEDIDSCIEKKKKEYELDDEEEDEQEEQQEDRRLSQSKKYVV